MQKRTIIKKIKQIIREHGDFQSYDIPRNSLFFKQLTNRISQFVEGFQLDFVEVYTYISDDDNETDIESYQYEDIDENTLGEILSYVEEWEALSLKTEKRCKN
jgi:hypothetical protein